MGSPVTVRLARLDDAEATRRIYNAEVTASTATFDMVPRSLEQQREWLTARSGAHAVLVAEDEADGVVGFASLSPWRDRPAYATSVEDSVYVHPGHQGRGIGKMLLSELLEVVGTEHEVGRKFGRWLDVVVMELLLGGGQPNEGRFRRPTGA